MTKRSKARSPSARKMPPAILLAPLAILLAAAALFYWPSVVAAQHSAILYKNPQCTCCDEYAAYLRRNRYDVKIMATHDLELVKQEHGVPGPLEGCHTMVVEGYVVEGHVPVAALNRLVEEKPAVKGISLPGMPSGSPGMPGPKESPFTIFAFENDGRTTVFATE